MTANTYFETQANTAGPGELVVMLYKGAVRFLAQAIQGLEAKDLQTASNKLILAQAIITELIETLDMKQGGELAVNLGRIYEYMNHRLADANVRKDVEPVRQIEGLLRELLPAWEQAARLTPAAPVRRMVSAAA